MFPVICEPQKFKIQPDEFVIFKKINLHNYPISINKSAFEILKLCDGKNTINEIIFLLNQKYQSEVNEIEIFVTEFLDNSTAMGIVKYELNKLSDKKENGFQIAGNNQYWTPDFIDIELTHGCILKCRHCYLNANEKKISSMIDFHRLSDLIVDFKEMGINYIQITGGEPILHPQFCEILDNIIDEEFSVILVTSGYYYNDNILKTLSRYCGKDILLQVSLDGLEDTHNLVRGMSDAFDKTVMFIKQVVSYGLEVDVCTTLCEEFFCEREIVELCRFLKEIGVKRHRISFTLDVGRAENNNLKTSLTFIKRLNEIVQNLKTNYEDSVFTVLGDVGDNKKNGTCSAGTKFIRMDPEFNIFACPLSDEIIGNAATESILDIIRNNSSQISRIAPNKQICGDCDYLFLCEGCISQGIINRKKVPKCIWFSKYGKYIKW